MLGLSAKALFIYLIDESAFILATSLKSGAEVAVKLEYHRVDPSLLCDEFETYKSLGGGKGIPQVYWFGRESEYRAMIFELLGPSLEDLFNYCGRLFSLKTVLMLVDQIIARLQYVHSKNVIHQDIKPENFLMGTGRNGNCVYITDMGLASEFLPHEAPPAARGSQSRLLGTANFASINGHRGIRQSPRDDMESLGYMILHFLKGQLPWHGLKGESREQIYQMIADRKAGTSLDELCSDVPEEFRKYMECVRALDFGDKPDHSRLRRIFRDLFVRQGFEHDYVFDWTTIKYMESLQQEP
ncbi:MAG: hypothetical protein Q9160_004474 [Pyrenula sp. 1 TL-2023]